MNRNKRRLPRAHLGAALLCLAALAVLLCCVKETQKRTLTPTRHKRQGQDVNRDAARPGPIATAVILDPSPYLPSVYSQEGLDALIAALQSKEVRLVRVSSWDSLFETKRGVKRRRADLAVVVSFQDVPNLATATAESQQECACKLSGSVIEVASGRVLDMQETEHEGVPGRGYEKVCLSAVLAGANAYSEVVARVITSYQHGGTAVEDD